MTTESQKPRDAQERARLAAALAPCVSAPVQKLWLTAPSVAVLGVRLPGRTVFLYVDARAGVALAADERPAAPDQSLPAQAVLRNALAGARFEGARLEQLEDAPGPAVAQAFHVRKGSRAAAPATTRAAATRPSGSPSVPAAAPVPAAASAAAAASAPAAQRRTPLLRLSFSTPRGPRALIAEPGARPLLLLLAPDEKAGAPEGAEKIVWLSADRAAGAPPPDRRPGMRWPSAAVVVVEEAATANSTSTSTSNSISTANSPTEEDSPPTAPPRAPPDRPPLTAASLQRADVATALAARRLALARRLQARTSRLTRTLAAVKADHSRALGAAAARHQAELLLPQASRVPRGAREAVVPDWTQVDAEGQPAHVTIALDPALGAAGNAARWLRKAHRYAAAVPRIAARRDEIEGALATTRALLARVQAAAGRDELRACEEEAATRGLLDERPGAAPGKRQGRPEERLPFRAFRSASGARILVGRNARDNDALTLRWARGNDLWLHARGVQGSHVVVPEPGEAPDQGTLVDAALLAAHFSSVRGQGDAEVAWTRRKHVRKVKGAAAGAVTYSQEKTIRVRLDAERLAALLASEGG